MTKDKLFCSVFPHADTQPIVMNAPLSGVFGPELVAAVSEAGGLGVVPAYRMSPETLGQFCDEVRQRTSRPFAIALDVRESPMTYEGSEEVFSILKEAGLLSEFGLPDSVERDADNFFGLVETTTYQERFEAAIAQRPAAMIALFGGFREPEEDRLVEEGILNMAVCTSLKEAKVLRSARAQALIVQGGDASGVRFSFEEADEPEIGLLTLLPRVVQATGLPVIALGGIYASEQVAWIRQIGAQGVMLGTALLATEESRADPLHRYFATQGTVGDTVVTRIYEGRKSRVLKNELLARLSPWESRIHALDEHGVMWGNLVRRFSQEGKTTYLPRPIGLGLGTSQEGRCAEVVYKLLGQ